MSRPPPLHLGFLASHGGSNLQAILDAIAAGTLPARACVVISNNSGALALERARAAGVTALHLSRQSYPDDEALDRAILGALRSAGVNLVVLAGYMKKLGPRVLGAYRGRVLNIHPALLPRHGGQGMFGMRVHEAVLAAGDRESGVTIHLVDEEYDRGPILAQARVPVLPGDTPETLAERVLAEEHRLYPDTLRRIAAGEITLEKL
ncbi:MAG: phosphoribosylglycinamide formyltransferase [Candidatus Lambdaproteobacteria bacterium]|nr:phosphoribosylglycinamide formyltransferase [Candidatus Lambdaproteobacteria bacterium]